MTSAAEPGLPLKTDLFLRPRRHRVLHCAVTAAIATAILFLYYAYANALPTPPGHYLSWFWHIFYFEFQNHVLGILMLIPILYAALALGWRYSSIVVLVLVAAVAPYIVSFSDGTLTLFESFVLLLVVPALVISIEILLISNAKERRTRAEKRAERAEVMRRSFSMQEDERRRIAQELHDSVAQTLLVNASKAHNIMANDGCGSDGTRAALEAIKQNSLEMVDEIRRICQDLRPSILDNLGLVSALKWLVDKLNQETGVNVELTLTGQEHELTQDENVAVFRIIQEALNNVKKHAGATLVKVHIAFELTGLSLLVQDNGGGFELPDEVHRYALSGRLGILGMHERAQSIGATLQIRSSQSSGTEVRLRTRSLVPGSVP